MLDRWLQIHLVLLSGLGMAMLGDLDQSRQLQFFFMVASVASILIVDVWKWTAVPPWAANLLALFAMIACARKFYSGAQIYQLSAVADLLLYLQLVLFFQVKNQRIYWVLLVLGLLRVIVASTVEPEAYFGPILLFFVVTAISTLHCFYLWREEERVKIANSARKPSVAPANSTSSALPPSATLGAVSTRAAAPTVIEGLQGVEFTPRSLLWSIAKGTFKITVLTLVLASIFFATMPRIGGDGWAMARFGQALSGFSPDVQLHSIASLQQNPDPVFRLRLENAYNQQPVQIEDPLYIQGNVLRFYGRSGGGGRYSWIKGDPGAAAISEINSLPTATGLETSLIRQHFTLDMPIRGTLFAIYPFYRTGGTPTTMRLVDKANHLQGSGAAGFEYTLLTAGIVDGKQNDLRAVNDREDPKYLDLVSFDRERFPGLRAKCNAILESSPNASPDRVATVRALAAYFQSSGEYTYSLDRSGLRIQTGIDPIEEFVTTSKKGYCQYFASALALMLRHKGIPCRLVNGYCTSEYNEVGKYYQVRQYHAHVWVEAYLEPQHLASLGESIAAQYPRGAWMRVDPTPETGLPAFQSTNSTVAVDSMNFAQILWRDYVVGMNPQRQQKMVYDPFKSTMLDSLRSFISLEAWRDWWARVKQTDGIREILTGNWFSWRGGLAAITICAGIYLLFNIARWMVLHSREWMERRKERQSVAKTRSKVEFYDRFEAILRRKGFVRATGQTPREFVAQIAQQVKSKLELKNEDSSFDFVELYYRVRFGEDVLSAQNQGQVEKLLAALSDSLSTSAAKSS